MIELRALVKDECVQFRKTTVTIEQKLDNITRLLVVGRYFKVSVLLCNYTFKS